MNKKFKKILFEEIDYFVDKLNIKNKDKTKQIINELFTLNKTTFLKDMGAQDIDDDGFLSNELDSELWDWFLQTITESIQEAPEEWIKLLKKEKLKTLCYKYFTKQELIKPKALEKELKTKLKKYFTALQNFSNLEQFREKITNLPSELLTNLIRFLLLLSPELKEKVVVTKKEFKDRVEELKKERMKIIEKISLISKKYQSVLDITKLKILYDNGVFFEDNLLNRGMNEYIVKLLNYENVSRKIKDNFSNTFVTDMISQAENSNSYAEHIQSIKEETGNEFFTEKGYQIGNRYENEVEIVKNKQLEGEIIDKNSVYKEPKGKIKDVSLPWENDELNNEEDEGNEEVNDDTNDSGMFSGGGGISSSSFGGEDSGFSFEEPDEGIPADEIATNETLPGTQGGQMGSMDTETEMPKNEEGYPVDFGSQETNKEPQENEDSGMQISEPENNNEENK